MSSLRSADRAKEDATSMIVEEERPVVSAQFFLVNDLKMSCNWIHPFLLDLQVPPFEPRAFPLTEEMYDKMLEVMPDGHGQASSASVCSREEEKDEDVSILLALKFSYAYLNVL